MNAAPRVAFDIGGTFTDIVIIPVEGPPLTFKILSVPEQIAADVRHLIDSVLQQGGDSEPSTLAHGTTIASNTIVEGKGAAVGLITTRGFRDELEMRRMARPPVFDFNWQRTPALVPRRWRKEVAE